MANNEMRFGVVMSLSFDVEYDAPHDVAIARFSHPRYNDVFPEARFVLSDTDGSMIYKQGRAVERLLSVNGLFVNEGASWLVSCSRDETRTTWTISFKDLHS